MGAPIATSLGAPLDVVLARKLPTPMQPELGFGAVAEDGTLLLDEDLVSQLHLTSEDIDEIAGRVRAELAARARIYRGARRAVPVQDRLAIVVDDGLATGVTLAASAAAARSRGASRVVAAVPVASPEGRERVARYADEVVCPWVDPLFTGVGAYYVEFPQLTDEEVVELLRSVPG